MSKIGKPDIEVSIVTGTYNRLDHLKHMVDSVRNSISVGIPYEIVVVDGGSTDGTIRWCEVQDDIRIIKQGKLYGAVKAFNEGARLAKGRYVILANDDIIFVDHSILAALSFMHDNPLVGVGCFYQDRGGREWHVGVMSAIVDGKQTTVYYGQVCIVPKWLGDYVGWWGDYLYTYGGDNELSCNVLELGYRVLPIPCAFIHDKMPGDELRVINNTKMMVNGKHPDTEAWLKKWTRPGSLGPIVKNHPDNPIVLKRPTRFFYMPIYEKGHDIQKQSKRGLRDALARVGIVTECDYLSTDANVILDMSCAIDADVIVAQLHGHDEEYLIDALKQQHPNAIFVNWNGDYHPEHLLSQQYVSFMRKFDHVGVVTTAVKEQYDAAGVNWFYWQIGYEEAPNIPIHDIPKHDILFLGNGYSRERIELGVKLRSLKGVDVGIYGAWPGSIKANGITIYDFTKGKALYKSCKIAIGDSQWPHATGFVSNRLFQAMAAGAFLLHQHFDGMEELLGLIPGKHLVVWTSWLDLLDKIKYYIPRAGERNAIAKAGQEFVVNNHSFDARVKELMRRLYA